MVIEIDIKILTFPSLASDVVKDQQNHILSLTSEFSFFDPQVQWFRSVLHKAIH